MAAVPELDVVRTLDFFGVVVFAVTGALAAGRRRMDVFGVVVVALATALGGGTARDLILGLRPFWVGDPAYVYAGVGVGLAAFITARFTRLPGQLLLTADALGLAVFTVIGCRKALDAECSTAVVLILGTMTGVTGGMMRDILCGRVPLIMRREIYATASLAGGAVYLAALSLKMGPGFAACAGAGLVVVVRLAAMRWNLALPVFRDQPTGEAETDGEDDVTRARTKGD